VCDVLGRHEASLNAGLWIVDLQGRTQQDTARQASPARG
jgi:hypothetical protein